MGRAVARVRGLEHYQQRRQDSDGEEVPAQGSGRLYVCILQRYPTEAPLQQRSNHPYGHTPRAQAENRQTDQSIDRDRIEVCRGGEKNGSPPGQDGPADCHDHQQEPAVAEVEQAAAQPLTEDAAAGTVLVIDDDQDAREITHRFLTKEGFRVVSAAGGQEGLRLARELGPDAIMLDVLMPSMDGWSVLSELKADATTAGIPVIMLTIVDNENMGYVLGASDYLRKPIDRDRLVAAISRYRKDRAAEAVLVLEDDSQTREMMRRTLEGEGWKVAEAENGRVGLQRLEEGIPRVILLDLMMPEMDGFEFVSEVMQREEWRSVPIVVVTAKDIGQQDREKLSGQVKKVIQKGAHTREQMVQEIRALMQPA